MRKKGQLTTTVVTSLPDLTPWEAEWKQLWQASADPTPFQSPSWLLPYLRIFRHESFKILLVRSGGRLVALFPFVIDNSGGRPALKLLAEDVSDYLDGLCREEYRSEVCTLAELWLAEELRRCECAEFVQLRKNAVLRSIPRVGIFREEVSSGVFCPTVSLRSPHGSTKLFPPDAMRCNVESSLQQITKVGSIRFELADNDSLDQAISNLFLLHTKRWQRRGFPGVFETSEKRIFYREAFRALKQASTIELLTLFLKNIPVAALAALRRNPILYYYIGAFDPDYSKFGPGNLIILHAMEFAAKSGCYTFDFLRGREPYKYRWSAQDEETAIRKIWL
jgi:CelD/BcsL family acetyltransferase involved in cellulose biosynthesis